MLSAFLILLMLCLAGLIPGMVQIAAALDSDTIAQLQTAKEIHVSTKRKSGAWSSAAPVWFWYADGVIYSTASPSSYKARRILDGRDTVRIAVGGKDGPTFTGRAEIFTDATIVERMGEAYTNKYWLAWFGFARPRVSRVESGKTVAIKVTPDAQVMIRREEDIMAIQTTYSQARANLAKLCDQVLDNQEVAIITRRGSEPVALIAASELTGLLETAHLLRSPKNAQRLITALKRAVAGTVQPQSVQDLRQELGLG